MSGSSVTPENKILPLTDETLNRFRKIFPLILIEGDGSKGKSIKGYADYEPVIPEWTDFIVTVVGMDIIGKKFSPDNVHRFEILKKILKKEEHSVITSDDVTNAIKKCYMAKLPPNKSNFLVLNKVSKKNYGEVEKIKERLKKESALFNRIFIEHFES
jgi:probable selenium-dependent hydroxylase accessory protein YqeC